MPQEQQQQMWNPVAVVQQKYPDMGLSEQQIYSNLSDPAKFRSAFPEYSHLSDEDIKSNMKKIGASNPDYQQQSRLGKVADKASEVTGKADKAITETLAPNPKNYQSLVRTNEIEVPKTLGREVYSGLKTIAGLPGGVYHAFADEPTTEEKNRYAQFEKDTKEAPGTETSGLKRIGLGIERMSGLDTAADAAKTYANPKTRPGYQQILDVAPEALGSAAGTVLAAEAGRRILPKAVSSVEEAAPAIKSRVAPLANAADSLINKGVRRVGYEIGSSSLGPQIERALPTIEKAVKRFGVDAAEAKIKPASTKPEAAAAPVTQASAPAEAEAADPLTKNMTPVARPLTPLGETLQRTEAALEPQVEAAKSALKPLGTDAAPQAEKSTLKPLGEDAAPEESAEIRQARHVLGNAAVDNLRDALNGPEAIRRLSKGTYQQFADLANETGIKKPAYLSEKNGDAWTANEFKRTTKEHGKSLSAPKEIVIRELLAKPPSEILQHTKPWVEAGARYPAKMSGLTERTMKALNLSEEAKNDMRSSGVSDEQAQALLAKLSKRQLQNLSGTNFPKP